MHKPVSAGFQHKVTIFHFEINNVLIENYSCFSSNFHPVILGFISKSWLVQLLLQCSHTEKWFILTMDLFIVCVCALCPSVMSDSFATPWTVAHQALLSMEFSRQEYWSELPFHSPGDLPRLRIKPVSPAWKVDSLPVSHLGSLHFAVGLRWEFQASLVPQYLLCDRHSCAQKKGLRQEWSSP